MRLCRFDPGSGYKKSSLLGSFSCTSRLPRQPPSLTPPFNGSLREPKRRRSGAGFAPLFRPVLPVLRPPSAGPLGRWPQNGSQRRLDHSVAGIRAESAVLWPQNNCQQRQSHSVASQWHSAEPFTLSSVVPSAHSVASPAYLRHRQRCSWASVTNLFPKTERPFLYRAARLSSRRRSNSWIRRDNGTS